MKKDSIMVLSGGMDSTTMLHDYAERIALAVTFDYGSNHNAREIDCARYNCALLGIELVEVKMDFIGRLFNSSLLSGADAIPEGDYADANMRSTVVPFRNGIMLAAAAGLAESRGLHTVMLANHSGDHSIYPDCRPGFVDAMSRAISEGTYDHISIFAPYTGMTKTEIAARGAQLGIDYAHTYSCYKGGERHCGRCGTCRERREALRDAGLDDPTLYEE
ncbi:MAG: 7-cyano-7-deazaguanine synthase QueC [Muribaculaceae bacterium]|jgi:7-cyano-7-deazaguanine synthase|nr:7-cyano-7-deazaguanine synthase QueC [Muribaculaceae bacterium]MCI9117163.1 7-cyano-7-deazaguanine synthase QueC [Muribaculaceae bacterium]